MNLTLKRNNYSEHGIYGKLLDEAGNEIAVTLEHAYQKNITPNSWVYAPKLPPGTYQCVRGQHKLHNTPLFETFEITNVPGHTGILLHAGNFNADSDGCILVGRQVVPNPDDPGDMITGSKNTLAKVLDIQKGLNAFTLKVLGDI